jgi:hypothetical protein
MKVHAKAFAVYMQQKALVGIGGSKKVAGNPIGKVRNFIRAIINLFSIS